jgi:hypothetical protein
MRKQRLNKRMMITCRGLGPEFVEGLSPGFDRRCPEPVEGLSLHRAGS